MATCCIDSANDIFLGSIIHCLINLFQVLHVLLSFFWGASLLTSQEKNNTQKNHLFLVRWPSVLAKPGAGDRVDLVVGELETKDAPHHRLSSRGDLLLLLSGVVEGGFGFCRWVFGKKRGKKGGLQVVFLSFLMVFQCAGWRRITDSPSERLPTKAPITALSMSRAQTGVEHVEHVLTCRGWREKSFSQVESPLERKIQNPYHFRDVNEAPSKVPCDFFETNPNKFGFLKCSP